MPFPRTWAGLDNTPASASVPNQEEAGKRNHEVAIGLLKAEGHSRTSSLLRMQQTGPTYHLGSSQDGFCRGQAVFTGDAARRRPIYVLVETFALKTRHLA